MNLSEVAQIKHDLLNSITIINSLTKSTTNIFLQVINKNQGNISDEQMNIFFESMDLIRHQTAKIEKYFQVLQDILI
ncbi:hypothetical protein [Legionella clemsonensis]|uniref:Uncharacterized protein n=1 Tax=Legionella clemsonensis TaxID=1867846 RepID=A0A222NYQ8_9GAMM|nr:hypothetical protein [Legionella clemsonensis]ASQ44718.1 hypothetical protein clem_00760 [Legionella clemsonensis]